VSALASWPVGNRPLRGRVLVVHGLGEHSKRYEWVAARLASAGYEVWAGDLRGHGQAPGLRGHSDRWQDLLDDVEEVWREMEARSSDATAPLAVLGHSLGGLIGLDWSLAHAERLRALVLSAPAFEVGFVPPPWKIALARFAARTAPTLAQSSGIRPEQISSVLEEIEAYRNDPQIHDRVTARQYVLYMEAATRLVGYALRLAWPTLVLAGGDDTVVSVAAVRHFAESNPARIEFHLYPGARHEIFHEAPAIREAAAEHLLTFLSRHLARGESS